MRPGQFEIVHSIGCNTQRGNVITIPEHPAGEKIIPTVSVDPEKVSPARRLTRWLYLNATCAAEKRLTSTARVSSPDVPAPRLTRRRPAELTRHYDIG